MIYFSRFSLGFVVIAALSFSGCSTGTAFDSYPGAAAIFGFSRPASPGSVPAAFAARDPDWDGATWEHRQP